MTGRKDATRHESNRSLIGSRLERTRTSRTTRTPPRTNAYRQWDRTFVYRVFFFPSLTNHCPTRTYEPPMGTAAFTGLGDGANYEIRDLRTVWETELERPNENTEETNRKSLLNARKPHNSWPRTCDVSDGVMKLQLLNLSDVSCLWCHATVYRRCNLDKKLGYRRETACQLHTSFSARSLIVQFTEHCSCSCCTID